MARKQTQNTKSTNEWKIDIALALLLVFLSLLAYRNSFRGEFVYDDTRQILENPVVTQPARLSQVFTSDVWAFRGDSQEAASNYWRPTFMLWLVGNYRLFGFESTVGWHWGSVLLHTAVSLLSYLVLRQWKLPPLLAGAAVALFAVHPVHVESVAWISGVTDVLLAVTLLGSLACVLSALQKPAWWKWGTAVFLYMLAVGSKEIGLFFPLFLFFIVWQDEKTQPPAWRYAAQVSAPFLAVAVLYFFLRLNILGQFEVQTPWRQSVGGLLLTAPSLLAFYVRQIFLPTTIGPSYPLRFVSPDNIGLLNFWIPIALLAFVAVGLWFILPKNRLAQIGVLLFGLFLLPVLNINAYLPEQLVHDRYLYLPLLGALMVAITAVYHWLKEMLPEPRAAQVCLIGSLALCAPLLWQTWQYNTAWSSTLALWEWGIQTDPTSAFNRTEYAIALYDAGRLEEAKQLLDEVLAESAVTNAYIARADVNTELGDLNQAAADLQLVIQAYPDDPRGYERLAIVYQQAGQIPQAIAVLQAGRQRIPYRQCAFASNLGVALYLNNQKTEALAELETIPGLLGSDYTSTCRIGLFHLAQLYQEQGNVAGAQEALQTFLANTQSFQDERVNQYRQLAQQQLTAMGQ